MGIYAPILKMILTEHRYRPIHGRTLCLGRADVGMTLDQFRSLCRAEGISVPDHIARMSPAEAAAKGERMAAKFLRGELLWETLGIEQLDILDVSDYEGADIIQNLNDPIPDDLRGRYDCIIDVGTFDHLVDIKTAFANVVGMLKDDGRIIQWNAASNFVGKAYLCYSPEFFYDYYAINGFADCKCYVLDMNSSAVGDNSLYYFDPQLTRNGFAGRIVSPRKQMVLVIAEKAPGATDSELPIQGAYRWADVKEAYARAAERMAASKRPILDGPKPYSWLGERLGRAVRRRRHLQLRTTKAFEYRGTL